MLNKVVLIGRLTKNPDLRHTQSGIAVARFTLAVDRGFKNQDGEKQADFIPITVWRGQAENCAKYLQKGRLVAVAGRIQTGSYDKDGQRVYTTDVVADEVRFLEWGEKREQGQDIPGFTEYQSDEPLPF
jgi:single-strand DNA-binding protein